MQNRLVKDHAMVEKPMIEAREKATNLRMTTASQVRFGERSKEIPLGIRVRDWLANYQEDHYFKMLKMDT